MSNKEHRTRQTTRHNRYWNNKPQRGRQQFTNSNRQLDTRHHKRGHHTTWQNKFTESITGYIES